MRYIVSLVVLSLIYSSLYSQEVIVISKQGDDKNIGSLKFPVRSLEAALNKAIESKNSQVHIFLRKGTYYLSKTLLIDAKYLQDKTLLISSYKNEAVTINGGKKLSPTWVKSAGKIWTAKVKSKTFEQLFVNGKKQVLARYPNFSFSAKIFNGTADDAISPQRVASWKDPENGYVHAMHIAQWGDFHYMIKGKKANELMLEGGWQNNRPSAMHPKYRFVENIFEELDSPGEWFFNKHSQTLFYYPPEDIDLPKATVEVSGLDHLVELRGTAKQALKNMTIAGLRFVGAERTFMKTYEPLMRSDWRIYRGAAIVMENTENCKVLNCEFTNLGGNAVFISRYNFESVIRSCYFHNIGANAICIVGDTSSVRSGANFYSKTVPLDKMDFTPGPKNSMYPRQCIVEDNLIHDIGEVEKQVGGVEIQIASEITVRHNTIYRVPRAAINIGDGSFGGHLIEYNDAFETVLETSDHGAFNSWGRDRYWQSNRTRMDSIVSIHPELILLDAIHTTVIRNNRFACDNGWDIDLDDGSSNYHIYNNLCLRGGLKLREGFFRVAENNIFINNSIHPHVWFKNSGDVIRRNILMRSFFPNKLQGWGKEVNFNFFPSASALKKALENGTDSSSTFGNLKFSDPVKGDFTIAENGEPFKIGFENFPMDRYGVISKNLKELSAKPSIPKLVVVNNETKMQQLPWLGGKIQSVNGLSDRSVYGLSEARGVIISNILPEGLLQKSGIQNDDVILKAGTISIADVEDLLIAHEKFLWTGHMPVEIIRNQQPIQLIIDLK